MKRFSFSVNFILKPRKQRADGTTPIHMRITVNKIRAEVSIHRWIAASDWNQAQAISKKPSSFAQELNDYISQCRSPIYQC